MVVHTLIIALVVNPIPLKPQEFGASMMLGSEQLRMRNHSCVVPIKS
jgi:hypothetical protein